MRENQVEDQSIAVKNQIQSIQSDGSSLDCIEILRNLQINGFGFDSAKVQAVRSLFDQILSIFLKEISERKGNRPIPAMLGNGQSVDLFKLYWIVRKKGGFDSVTSKKQWGLVAEEAGLGSDVGSSVKLIYVTYLDMLDRWLQMIFDEKGISGRVLSVGLETEIKLLLHGSLDRKINGRLEAGADWKKALAAANQNGHADADARELSGNECATINGGDDDEVIVEDAIDVNGNLRSSLKRKHNRECLLGMLNWVMRIAKNPGDPVMGRMSERSGRKAVGVKEYCDQVLAVRKMLFLRWPVCLGTGGSLWQKMQRMHPNMYEDYIGVESMEKLRYSRRILSIHNRARSCSCSDRSPIFDNDLDTCLTPHNVELGNDPNKRVLRTIGSLSTEAVVGLFCKDQLRKRVPVGPCFQAEMPDWTGASSESSCYDSSDSDDSKWLGTLLWPCLKPNDHETLIEKDSIGKGRPDSCGCKLPGSVECIRFHVAEKRFQLKPELGSAFYTWRLHHMGEEVSLSWMEEEEHRFKLIVQQNPPSMGKNFWSQIYRSFQSRSRQSLVSYYFNVFLLRRRSYQNRFTPKNIDSDDEESEFGYESNSVGDNTVLEPNTILCIQNKQCMDLEESIDMT